MSSSARAGAAGLIVAALSLTALASTRPKDDHVLERPATVPSAAVVALRDGDALDLNQASTRELALLPSVGPKLAARIVAEREIRHGFRRVDDLLVVRGIGPATYARIQRFVRVGPIQAESRRLLGGYPIQSESRRLLGGYPIQSESRRLLGGYPIQSESLRSAAPPQSGSNTTPESITVK